MTKRMTRRSTLETALDYVVNDRNIDNGDPEDNFGSIAELWTYWLRRKYNVEFSVTPTDVAMMSLMIKIARLLVSESKADNWIDIAGYAACGAETAGIEEERMAGPFQKELPIVERTAKAVSDGTLSSDDGVAILEKVLGMDLTPRTLRD